MVVLLVVMHSGKDASTLWDVSGTWCRQKLPTCIANFETKVVELLVVVGMNNNWLNCWLW